MRALGVVTLTVALLGGTTIGVAGQDADLQPSTEALFADFVTEEVDVGPIIAQEAVPVLPHDNEATLHARLQEVEHRLYPAVVDALARGLLALHGRTVVWKEEP